MIRVLAAGLLALSTAACTATLARVDASIQANAPIVCSSAPKLHASFLVLAGTGQVPQKWINVEAAGWAGVSSLCADLSSLNSDTILIRFVTAYAEMRAAYEAARAVTGG